MQLDVAEAANASAAGAGGGGGSNDALVVAAAASASLEAQTACEELRKKVEELTTQKDRYARGPCVPAVRPRLLGLSRVCL